MARVYFGQRAILDRLASRLDIWEANHSEGYLLALLGPQEYAELAQQGLRVEVDAAKTALLEQRLQAGPGQTAGIPGFPCYRTVEETNTSLASLASAHPDLAVWKPIGDSWDRATPGGSKGYPLSVLVLTKRSIAGPKPRFFLMAEIHARELTTAELATRFAEYLVARYGEDADVTWLLDYSEIHIAPLTNPDGRKWAEQGYFWRKNNDNSDGCLTFPYYGADLNRNSSDHWGGVGSSDYPCDEVYRGRSAASEPETQAIQSYAGTIFPDQRGPDDHDPAPSDATGLFVTLHSYGGSVLFPWGWTQSQSPNFTQLQSLGRKLGFFNDYQVCEAGDCLYLTSGSTDDWVYGQLGVASYTFEMGTDFFESCSYFEKEIVPNNTAALLYAFKAARRPYQAPSGPDSLRVSVSAPSVEVGGQVVLSAVADDTRYSSGGHGDEPVQHIAAARYTVDAPSWAAGVAAHPMNAGDGVFDAPIESLTATIATAGWPPGRHLILVESRGAAGNWGVPGAAFLDVNSAGDRKELYLPLVAR